MASPSENSNLLTYSLHSAGLKSQITFAGPDMANKSPLLEMSSPLSERDGTSIPLTRGHRELRLRPWLCVTACQPTRGPGGISQITQGTMNFPSVSSLREHRHQYSISLSALAFNLWTGVTGWGEKGCRGGWIFLFKASLPRPTLSERCGKRLALFAESREKKSNIAGCCSLLATRVRESRHKAALPERGCSYSSGAGEIAAITQHDPLPGSGQLISVWDLCFVFSLNLSNCSFQLLDGAVSEPTRPGGFAPSSLIFPPIHRDVAQLMLFFPSFHNRERPRMRAWKTIHCHNTGKKNKSSQRRAGLSPASHLPSLRTPKD